MKKSLLRSIVVIGILAAVGLLLFRYWSMKREVPEHARVIPSDAFAVLTLNVREIATDLKSEDHLFPEMAEGNILDDFGAFSRIIENVNGETGVEKSSDILLFVYHTGDQGFFGAVADLDDSTAFGKMIREQVQKEYKIVQLSQGGNPIMQFDTTAAVFGYTEDAALFLYPLGDHSVAAVSAQCSKLLKQQRDNSVIANENFREMELENFSMGLWIQSKPLLSFTEGGALIRSITNDVEAYSYFADFQDGEILIRSKWLLPNDTKREMIKEFAFPCEPSLINYFIRGHFDKTTSDGPVNSFAGTGIQNIPVAEEEYPQLFSGMTGDFISISNINPDTGAPSETYCFLLSDPAQTKTFISAAMERDSIPLTTQGWKYTAYGDNRWRMLIDGNLLTITNNSNVDGRHHAITVELAGYMSWFNVHNMLSKPDGRVGDYVPLASDASAVIAQHVSTCTSTIPVQFGNVRYSEIVVRFTNKEVNSLVQCEELIRKIYFTK